jgi:glyoxylase I family protein
MKLSVEHVAWQTRDPRAVAAWYAAHLGFRTVREVAGDPNRTLFLADASGKVVVEIYSNPAAPVPDYASMHYLQLHLAFAVTGDIAAARDELLAAGCRVEDPLRTTPAGDELCMLRDPFGFAIQLCKRAKPML